MRPQKGMGSSGRERTVDQLSTLNSFWSTPAEQIFEALASGYDGLTQQEAARRLREVGPNSLQLERHFTVVSLLLRQFTNPLVLILIFAAVVSSIVKEWVDASVILAIVISSGVISFFQEYSAGNAIAKLRRRIAHQSTALRDGKSQLIPSDSIVPGDVLLLSAGSLVPADCVLLETQDFFVSQAALTGETFPVEKRVGVVDESVGLPERTNCAFAGTSVRSGLARALVVATASSTEYGKIADRLGLDPEETEFERGIRTFGLMLSRIMIAMIIGVFAINVISDKPAVDALLFAIALAVGISPELLPAIITINLSKGARELARKDVIVRRLSSIEDLGSMDVLCTDKTGTLTEGVIRLDAALDGTARPSEKVRRLGYLNARYQNGLSNPLDEAIVQGLRDLHFETYERLAEIPFDFGRRMLSVAIKDPKLDEATLITKGAVENVLSVCSTFPSSDGDPKEIGLEFRQEILQKLADWGSEGFRVLGVASKSIPTDSNLVRSLESEMNFEGFLLFFDPPKIGIIETLRSLRQLNVHLKIISGDNRFVVRHVADQVHLNDGRICTGSQVTALSNEALGHAVEVTSLFAEVDPSQKERIIRALQKRGHVVGYLGDGINDAPALKDADVGISVDKAVDVAREAADLVLLRKGLDVLHDGIIEGRRTFANSLKYILTTSSANFGNMFSMAAASMFLPFLPLTAKQILLNNFLSDFPAIAIATDNVDRESVYAPHKWDANFIRRFMILFGFVSSAFDLLTFGILIYFAKANEYEFQTGWFIESLLTELLVAMVVRTRRRFYKSKPGRWLSLSTALVIAITIAIPYLSSFRIFGFVPLPVELLLLIILISVIYTFTTDLVKGLLFQRLERATQGYLPTRQ